MIAVQVRLIENKSYNYDKYDGDGLIGRRPSCTREVRFKPRRCIKNLQHCSSSKINSIKKRSGIYFDLFIIFFYLSYLKAIF